MAPITTRYQDPWSFFDYKKSFKSMGVPAAVLGNYVPTWVGDHWRRLTAYRLLDDYYRNCAWAWMDPDVDEEERLDKREYGDAALLVDSILSSVIGDAQTILVEGAVDEVNAEAETTTGETPPSENDEDDAETIGPRSAQQAALRKWALDERFIQKLLHNERNGIKLGDMVYVLGIDEKKKRPKLRCWDAGFYFPVLDDWSHDEDYPTKVYFAWEYEKVVNGEKQTFVRRQMYELLETEQDIQYPWNPGPVKEACFFEEIEWKINDAKGELQDFERGSGTVITELEPLGVDFIPVVHIPNDVAEEDHFGISSLARVMQNIDDLSAVDTDLQQAADTTATPVLGIGGASLSRNEDGSVQRFGPGEVIDLGDGRLDSVDMSKGLDALLKLNDAMKDRLSINARTPKTLLGAVDPEKVPSGIVLTLSFQPHSNMIRQMRLVRGDGYSLLLKFVSRMLMITGALEAVFPVAISFGSFLPADRQEVASMVSQGITNHSMSVETAVALMIEAGLPIDDARMEVVRIIRQNFTAAKSAFDASGDIEFTRDLLGLPPLSADELAALTAPPPATDPNATPPPGPTGQPGGPPVA